MTFFIVITVVVVIIIALSHQNKQNIPTQEQEHRNNLEVYRECNPMTAESKLKIVQDCIRLVNETKNPEVFFSRYEKLMQELKALSNMEGRVRFSGQLPSVARQDFLSRKKYTVNDFIERYYNAVNEKVSKLTTEKAKINNIDKFYESLVLYRYEMPPGCFDLVEEKYAKLKKLHHINTTNTTESQAAPKTLDNATQALATNKNLNTATYTDDWNIIVSFNKSTSANFEKALYWAKKSTDYQETEYNGSIIYQAMYTAEPQSFTTFIQLYDLVKDWKSTAFIINGEIIDKKIIAKIKWCYGDKCITGKSDFCYGASYMTKNPFGCHRLQISACNNPWWSFGTQHGDRIKIDKDAIIRRINDYSSAYKLCPAFNYNKAIAIVSEIPDYITLEEKEKLQFRAYNDTNAFLGIK